MVDHVVLSSNESIMLDTTNNTITVVLVDAGSVQIKNENDVVFATLQDAFEMFTLAIGTGVFTAKNTGSSNVNILVVREFIY
jgi:hypothetical protein